MNIFPSVEKENKDLYFLKEIKKKIKAIFRW